MAHTPGPWEALQIEGTTRHMISQVPPGNYAAPFYIASVYSARDAPVGANAALIAAAPELLAECKAALWRMEQYNYSAMHPTMNRLSVAIAKAEPVPAEACG